MPNQSLQRFDKENRQATFMATRLIGRRWELVVMAVCAVDMAVSDFFGGGGADFGHFAFEAQLHAGQRVVAVYHGSAVGDVGYAVN